MKINSVSNYHNSNKQNFGARLDNNTRALIRIAKEKGINTDRMEELMKSLYPNGEVHTGLFKNREANEKNEDIEISEVLIGAPEKNEILFRDIQCGWDGFNECYFIRIHNVNKKVVDIITQKLEEINENGEKYKDAQVIWQQ